MEAERPVRNIREEMVLQCWYKEREKISYPKDGLKAHERRMHKAENGIVRFVYERCDTDLETERTRNKDEKHCGGNSGRLMKRKV